MHFSTDNIDHLTSQNVLSKSKQLSMNEPESAAQKMPHRESELQLLLTVQPEGSLQVQPAAAAARVFETELPDDDE